MNTLNPNEALNKLCPFSFNNDSPRRCIASRCMAWRFETPEYDERTLFKAQFSKPDQAGKPVPYEYEWRFHKDVQKDFDRYIAQGYEVYVPPQQQLYPDEKRVHIRKRNLERVGFCGLAEPRVAYVERE